VNFLKIRSGISSTGLPETASRQVISIQNVMEKGNTRTHSSKDWQYFYGFCRAGMAFDRQNFYRPQGFYNQFDQ